VAHEREHAQAKKRGGGLEVFSWDSAEAEQRYRREPVDDRDPEKIFEHRWAMTLLDEVLARLANEFTQAGKEKLFAKIQPFLVEGKGAETYLQAAEEIGMTEAAFKKAVQRMRQRYGELFRMEIARTVAGPQEVEEELRYLRSILSS
jgi:RNA polymerase sigma-70 factor (ECF subfamily)